MSTRLASADALTRSVIPAVLISGVVFSLALLPDPLQVLLPLVAFGSGYYFRPHRTWVIWLASALIVSAGFASLWLLGYQPPKTADPGPANAAGIAFDTGAYFVYLAALALAPLWFGRRFAERRTLEAPPAR